MGMFSRMSDIVQSNINALLDKAEDPEKVIKLIIEEMQETLVEVRSIAAKQIADKKYLDRQIDKMQMQVLEWSAKAQKAVEAQRDDLARAALEHKVELEARLHSVTKERDIVLEQIDKLQADCQSLQDKISEAKQKQRALSEKSKVIDARLKMKQQQEKFDVDNVIGRFENYERKIDEMEAKVEAFDLVGSAPNLSEEFRKLEANEAVERELAELKKQVA